MMVAGCKIVVARNARGWSDAPVVEYQDIVHIDAHAVVNRCPEAVVAAGEILGARPTYTEVAAGQPAAGAVQPPVERDSRIVAHHDRRAGQVTIGEV